MFDLKKTSIRSPEVICINSKNSTSTPIKLWTIYLYENEIKLYLTGSHFVIIFNYCTIELDFCARKKAHSISPKGNIFLGKKYDYPILGSEIQAIIFCVMSKTCCKTFSFSILCTELYWVLAFCSKHAPKQHNSISVKPTVYTLGQWARSYSLALVHLLPSWLV